MGRISTDLMINKISDYVAMVRDAPPPTPTGVVYHRHGCKPVCVKMGCAVTEPRRGDTKTPQCRPCRGYHSSSVIHCTGVNTPAYGVSFLRNLDGA